MKYNAKIKPTATSCRRCFGLERDEKRVITSGSGFWDRKYLKIFRILIFFLSESNLFIYLATVMSTWQTKQTRRRLFCKYVNKYMFKIIKKSHITAVLYWGGNRNAAKLAFESLEF